MFWQVLIKRGKKRKAQILRIALRIFFCLVILVRLFIRTLVGGARHPAMLAGVLLFAALFSSLVVAIKVSSWGFYLLALVFLGGVIVVLLFMVSVCSNEKFLWASYYSGCGVWIFGGFAALFWAPELRGYVSFRGTGLPLVVYQAEFFCAIVMLIVILVLCMISVVKIRNIERGPLVGRL